MPSLLACLLGGCSLPSLHGRSESHALTRAEAADTPLGRALQPGVDEHPQASGILPLEDARNAFAARILLAGAAQRTLDVQYYIWHDDITGTLLLDALRQAAERGVRVRLLLDDNGVAGMDELLAALDRHPNIEVRLFNPFSLRTGKALGYLTHFSRANRRMHNKSMTADSQATILGGRNVGDEYFGATDGVLFADLDVLAIGDVAQKVSGDFDRYWSSASSYPVDRLLPAPDARVLEGLQDSARQLLASARAQDYRQALQNSGFVAELLQGRLAPTWARVELVSDDPRKGVGMASDDDLLLAGLQRILGQPTHGIDLVSPYFVPTAAGVDALARLADQGIGIRILTNALESTDVAAVHAGYAKRRKALLEKGIRLYEMRSEATAKPVRDNAGPFGSSGSSLHAKTFAVDGERAFVGSFNFDPRSARLNTEMGLVIESPELARKVTTAFDEQVPESAYEVVLDEHGKLNWIERRDGHEIRHTHEPGASLGRRATVRVLSWLPIEWLL